MGLAEIVEAIRVETDAEIDRRRQATEEKAQTLLEAAAQQAAVAEAQTSTRRDLAARQAADRIENRARLEADRQARAAVEEVFQSALHRVTDRLQGLRNTAEYREILGRQLDDVLADLPDGTVLQVDPRDVDLATEMVADRSGPIRVEPTLACWGGFVLDADDGRRVDNTFEDRLRRAEDLLRMVASIRVEELDR